MEEYAAQFQKDDRAAKTATWISVKDRLPAPRDGSVLAYGNGDMAKCFVDGRGYWFLSNQGLLNPISVNDHITHWMPLPQPPLPPESDQVNT